MSTSRKRYRPLDAAEERAITASQRLQLLPLEDEQSYCFSWPEAPLTQWLQEDVPYTSLYQLCTSTASGGSGGGVSSHNVSAAPHGGGASAVTVHHSTKGANALPVFSPAVRRDTRGVEVPPVFLLDDGAPAPRHGRVLKVSSGPRSGSDVQGLLRGVQEAMATVRRSAASAAAPPPSSPSSSSTAAHANGATRAVPHPLAPPRPQSVTEDSILSLSTTQLEDVVAAGVPALHTSAIAEEDTLRPPTDCATPSASNGCPAAEAPRRHPQMTALARYDVEQEVVGLEWRTWSQSQRTAAALQRLLSLEAAVPFEGSGHARRDAWRAVVHRLWLRWRQQGATLQPTPAFAADRPLAPAPLLDSTLPGGSAAGRGLSSSNNISNSNSSSSGGAQHLPWGAPLLAGAYLCGTSNDYFMSLPPASSTGTAGAAGGGVGGAGSASLWPTLSRRRGAYGFLRWKVELYDAQMPRTTPGAVDDEEDDGGGGGGGDEAVGSAETTRGGGARHGSAALSHEPDAGAAGGGAHRYSKGPLGEVVATEEARVPPPRRRARRGGGGEADDDARDRQSNSTARRSASAVPGHAAISGAMSAARIKALLQTTVLTRPLTELEMDDDATTVMGRLACPDLRRDTAAWRVWLSKV
ncbi:hypothetical protein NESM_000491200 [Novymonas esmeraldas]|uniref:Uncharacterized protein n=1 Tax=Novymonas esmeraldas TaxID=1808958 RepID=A0AAW0ENM2_9TRYP